MNNAIFIHATSFIYVTQDSQPPAVAELITQAICDGKLPVLEVVGAGAADQALEATCIARSHLGEDGIDLLFTTTFTKVEVDGRQQAAVLLEVIPCTCSAYDPPLLIN